MVTTLQLVKDLTKLSINRQQVKHHTAKRSALCRITYKYASGTKSRFCRKSKKTK